MADNQRKSFRIPILEGQESAVVRFGRRTFSGRVVNTSADGLAIAVSGSTQAAVDDVMRVQTPAGWTVVRVARVEAGSDGESLLGLERVCDEFEPLGFRWSHLLEWIVSSHARHSVGGPFLNVLMVVGVVATLGLAGALLLDSYRAPDREATSAGTGRGLFASISAGASHVREGIFGGGPRTNASVVVTEVSSSLHSGVAFLKEWQSHAEETATKLGLTSDQARRLDDIAKQLSATGPQTDVAELERRILEILTPEQVARLRTSPPSPH